MSGIDRMTESIKRKISLKDHKPQLLEKENTSTLQDVKTSNNYTLNLHEDEQVSNSSLSPSTLLVKELEDKNKSVATNTSKLQEVKKYKTTVYFSEDSNRKFNEIYAKRILADKKTDKSIIIDEAIELLYQKEISSP